MGFEQLVHYAGYFALIVLGILFAGNVVIVGAKLFHRFGIADAVIHLLAPVSDLFQLRAPPESHIGRHGA